MTILIVTGNLAYSSVEKVASESDREVIVHLADSQIAAFLTPRMIIKELKNNYEEELNNGSIDLIITPGLMRKSTDEISESLNIPTFKGPTDGADIGMVLDLIDDLKLSTSKPADKLIEEEKRKKAIKLINEFESDIQNRKKLLEKPNNILVGNLTVGEDFPMRILAEIANAPILTKEELIRKCEYFLINGADMIDIGMVAGEDFSDKIPDMITTLRPIVGNKALSIDTLNPKEISVAIENGIDLVLSIDLGNYKEVLPLLKKYNVPAVALPTNFSEEKVPHTVDERVNSMIELAKICIDADVQIIADLILDPVNSSSIVDSILACRKYHEKMKEPMFFGVGNVNELVDTDSVGVNALLSGIAMELGASILFTPEESGKTLGSVYELAISSKMMFLAKQRGSIPKDLGINLILYKDKKKRKDIYEDYENSDFDVPLEKATESVRFILDPAGSFKIRVEHAIDPRNSKIIVTHFKKTIPDLTIEGRYVKEIYDELVRQGIVTRLEHAAYLGSELQKAEIAMITGKEYVQDFDLFKRSLDLN
ncbi:dihydropteroate synthase [Methanobrevibacter arboriphilus]|jgi:dihydropteroate synthase-like protein|uniref:Dihydropteroate synthase n=1 Tax=Methanobrevibacter arboriphilus TaxID=39441 RepID=A0ACA8R2I6_METAZ|nr:dihydropteroate synthase-like protein [Methanobrevibacter arboriphilus]BBL61813.1 dihydropteroate synthase [Methanobrevibacter arboriphilus]GLI10925.1 dihydropteroate synthase [Methanobrevibacter arboriphilus]